MTGIVDARRTLRPTTLAEARDAVSGDSATLLFRGSGTKLEWGAPPDEVDTVVETGGLHRLLAHDPDDAVATVQAGMPLQRLQEHLARHNQRLAIDPPTATVGPDSPGATVGGVFAANDAGPRRLRYGTMRDLVIGITVVLADGAVGRSGGRVIKNVAGYDLAKLFCGSLGTLGLVAEITVRLHPLPAADATLRVDGNPADGVGFVEALRASALEPSAVEWIGDGGMGADAHGQMLVRFESNADAVGDQVGAARDLAARHGLPAAVLAEVEEDAAWRRVAEHVTGTAGETVVRAAALPSQWPSVAASLRSAAEAAGVDATLCSSAGLGLHTARLSGGDTAAHAAAVTAWRRELVDLGGHAVVRRRVTGLDEQVDVWGPPPSAIALMRRVKEQFDPDRRCAPGRFVGGI